MAHELDRGQVGAGVERALAALGERLRPTGRRLRPVGWHRYALGPHLGILTGEERSHLRRSASDGLDHDEAAVLFQIARGFASVGLFASGPGAQAVLSLQWQGLIERNRGSFVLSSDVAFSLGLDD